jgi:Protein of unknown function (DUF2905)
MRRIFIAIGIVCILIGIAWPWLSKLPLGRLPGDIVVDRPGMKFFFPLTTMIIVSVILSLLMWLFRK